MGAACGSHLAPLEGTDEDDDGFDSEAAHQTAGGSQLPPQGFPDTGMTLLAEARVDPGAPFSFEVPPGVLGVTALATTEDRAHHVGVRSLVGPSGAPLVVDFKLPGFHWLYWAAGASAALVPQSEASEAFPPAAGPWTATFESDGDSSLLARAWARTTDDGEFHGGAIDVNLYAPTGANLTYLSSLLHVALDGFAGLSLGTVTLLPLSENITISTEGELATLFSTSSSTSRPASVNLFVVENLTGPYESALGVSSGIPGDGMAHGTSISGIAVEVWEALETDALVIRHELGHMMGLFHTTELNGKTDPLGDTPSCPDVTRSDCPDRTNVMFPYAEPPALELSETQLGIIHASALYRGRMRAEDDAVPTPPTNLEPLPSLHAALPPSLFRPGCSRVAPIKEALSTDSLFNIARRNDVPGYVQVRALEQLAKVAPRALESALRDPNIPQRVRRLGQPPYVPSPNVQTVSQSR